jgi:hypothetical protein
MQPTGKQIEQCQNALLAAYPSEAALRQMLWIELDQSLDAVAGGPNLESKVFDLLLWATSHGEFEDLMVAAYNRNPRNPVLCELVRSLGLSTLKGAPHTEASSSATVGHHQSVLLEKATTWSLSYDTNIAAGYNRLIARLLNDRALRPFVGAGLSIGAGLPGWYDLVAELAKLSGQDDMPPRKYASADMLIAIAQTFVNRYSENDLITHLKERLDTTGKVPTAVHRALADLPLNVVFTANYDDLLERAFRDAGRPVEVIVRDNHIPYMSQSGNRVNVVKLYGDLGQPDTLVLTRQHYEQYFRNRPQLMALLKTELARSTMLYLGWSHNDPHFGLVFGELLSQYASDMRDAQLQELARKNIKVVELPPGMDLNARLAAWLQFIGSATDS